MEAVLHAEAAAWDAGHALAILELGGDQVNRPELRDRLADFRQAMLAVLDEGARVAPPPRSQHPPPPPPPPRRQAAPALQPAMVPLLPAMVPLVDTPLWLLSPFVLGTALVGVFYWCLLPDVGVAGAAVGGGGEGGGDGGGIEAEGGGVAAVAAGGGGPVGVARVNGIHGPAAVA